MASVKEEFRIIFPVVSDISPTGVIYKIPPEGHVFTLQSILDRGLYTTDDRIVERFGKQLLKYPYDRSLIVNPEDINSVIITKNDDIPVTHEYILDNYVYYKIDTGLRYKKHEIHMLVHAKMFKDDISDMLEKSGSKYVKSNYDEREDSLNLKKQSLKELKSKLKEREELLDKREETFNLKEDLLKQQEDLIEERQATLKEKTDKLKYDEESFKKTIGEFRKLMKVNKLIDPPQRPASSYMFFAREIRHKIREENPNLNMEEISRIIGERWKDFSYESREKYMEKAAYDKERYLEEVEQYKSLSDQYIIEKGLNILRERISKMRDLKEELNEQDEELNEQKDKFYKAVGIK
jgi:hypothetical protein